MNKADKLQAAENKIFELNMKLMPFAEQFRDVVAKTKKTEEKFDIYQDDSLTGFTLSQLFATEAFKKIDAVAMENDIRVQPFKTCTAEGSLYAGLQINTTVNRGYRGNLMRRLVVATRD